VRLTWPDLGSWVVDNGTSVPPRFAQTPAAAKIQLLDESGNALDVAPMQVPVISSAIAGAKPGQPQLPKDFVAQPAQPWPVPPSDPLVTTAGVWYAPPGCNPKAGWVSGSPPPLGASVGASDGGSVPNVDAQGGWGDLASADSAGAAAKPAAVKADSGCAAAVGAPQWGPWPVAALLVAIEVVRRRRWRG